MTRQGAGSPEHDSADSRSRSDTRHLLKASLVVTGIGLTTRITGLLTQVVVLAVFGANRVMDAFLIVRSIPQLVSTWIEMPVRAAIVPFFTRKRKEQGEDAAWAAVSNIINTLAVVLLLLAGAVYLNAGWIVRAFATGFDEATWVEMTALTRIVIFSVVFSVLAVVLGSLHNIYRQQQFPALGRFANAIVVLAAIFFLGNRYGLTGYAVGLLAGSVTTLLIQSWLLWQHRGRYRFIFRPAAPEIRELLVVAFPLFIGLTGTRIDVFVDQNFASWLSDEGSLTVLLVAIMFASVATDLVITVSSTVLLPHFAGLVAEGRFHEMRYRLLQSLGGYLLLLLPVSAFLIVGARPLVNLIFLHGRFTPDKANLLAELIPIIAIASPVYAMGQVFAQAHISAGDTKTPMKVGFWRLAFKLIVTIALILPYGIVALAASSSASSFFRTALLWRRLPERMRPVGSTLGRLVTVMTTSAAAGGVVGWAFLQVVPPFPGGQIGACFHLALAAGVVMGVHLCCAAAMSPQARATISRLVRKS